MTKFALYVPLKAKPGKEEEVAEFLRSALPLVNAEAVSNMRQEKPLITDMPEVRLRFSAASTSGLSILKQEFGRIPPLRSDE